MAEPLVFISTWRIAEGRVADLEAYYRRVVEIVEAKEPQIIAFHGFLDEDGTEFTSIQVHPDADSMEFHMTVLRENWEESFAQFGEWAESTGVQYLGTPPESARVMDRQLNSPVTVKPRHLGGFTRGG
ncbi:MAG: hypothetical protein WD184_05410 [Acidimicrobiia bacterium]